jgi:hypothetical protein
MALPMSSRGNRMDDASGKYLEGSMGLDDCF